LKQRVLSDGRIPTTNRFAWSLVERAEAELFIVGAVKERARWEGREEAMGITVFVSSRPVCRTEQPA